jgi:ATP-dependent DNA helicase RecG
MKHMSENYKVEYKEIYDKGKVTKEIVGFLNSKAGGAIYIGITDSEVVKGVTNIDSIQLKIKDIFRDGILPSPLGLFEIKVELKEDKEVIRINLSSGTEKPYYIKRYGMSPRGAYIRIASATEQMNQRTIDELYSSRTRNSLASIKSRRQDLSFKTLRIYYEEKGMSLNDNFAKTLELVNNKDEYNYIAYLLNDINNLPFQVAKYSGIDKSKLIEKDDYGNSSLVKVADNILNRFIQENRTLTEITPTRRKEILRFDEKALREIIINAIVHNDYTNEYTPQFDIYIDRIEISSHGGLPLGYTKEEFFNGFSKPRNKELMRVFNDLSFVERLGSGVGRVLDVYPKEVFKFYDNHLRVVINFSDRTENTTIVYNIDDREGTIVKFISNNKIIKTEDVEQLFNVQSSGARKILRGFEDKSVIKLVPGSFPKEYILVSK